MEWSRYPLEKLLYFAAGVIPGFTVLVISELARPGMYQWFLSEPFLGYRTKMGLVALATFIVGYSLTSFLRAILGGIGGAYGEVLSKRPYQPPHSQSIAPWRDPRWRAAVATHLTKIPNDTRPISPEILKTREQMIQYLPPDQQASARYSLNSERLSAEMDDLQWEQWYDHFHEIVLKPDDRDVFMYVRWGLNLNLETAAMCIVTATFFVPRLRHWWCIVPACFWIVILLAEEYWAWTRYMNKWSTLSAQIKYLRENAPANRQDIGSRAMSQSS